eukprot:TRINITY_DN12039_c0_g1_i1.p2 TRINITY_DN12039_c0_g1~~TRINITY_DN12039_c0_g1_i1.p2  ORF type:complete len:1011 (+),score=215.15 TRINITY_DN12039_c0_g1_i1:4924-7956(+)
MSQYGHQDFDRRDRHRDGRDRSSQWRRRDGKHSSSHARGQGHYYDDRRAEYSRHGSRRDHRDDGRYNDRSSRSRDDRRPREPPLQVFGRQQLFEKHFTFDTSQVTPATAAQLFVPGSAEIRPDMKAAKDSLNGVKSKLDTLDQALWYKMARSNNPTGCVVRDLRNRYQVEMPTIAWSKMFELLSKYQLGQTALKNAKVNTVHVCEAPGAFIAATNHYLRQLHGDALDWDWTGLTLNPYYEDNNPNDMLVDDLFILYTEDHWHFGKDNTGNIMHASNLRELRAKAQAKGPVMLVSGDGGIDCSADPGEQERLTSHLHYCEAVAALACLSRGGACILKMFTLFERETEALLYLLAGCFEQVHACKPATSKAANSESYVVATGFKELTSDVLDRLLEFINQPHEGRMVVDAGVIPDTFTQQVASAAVFLAKFTEDHINNVIECSERRLSPQQLHELQGSQREVAQTYVRQFQVQSLPVKHRIVPQEYLDGFRNLNSLSRISSTNTDQSNTGIQGATLKDRQQALQATAKRAAALRNPQTPTADDSSEQPAKRSKRDPEAKPAEKKKLSFAERMMQKMGHEKGKGLGKNATGRVEPVAVEQRDARSGLGVYQLRNIEDLADAPSAPLYLAEDDISDLHPIGHTDEAKPVLDLVLGQPLKGIRLSKFCRMSILRELQEARLSQLPFVIEQLQRWRKGDEWPVPLLSLCPQLLLTTALDPVGAGLTLAHVLRAIASEPTAVAVFGKDLQSDHLRELPSSATYVTPVGLKHPEATIVHFTSDDSTPSTASAWQSALPSGCQIDMGIALVATALDYAVGPGKGRSEPDATCALLSPLLGMFTSLSGQGNAVVQLGDCFTRLSVSILYLLHLSFDKLQIIKPMTSLPLASARYVLCMSYRGPQQAVIDVLECALTCNDVSALLSMAPIADMLKVAFLSHVVNSNERIAIRELAIIRKLHRGLTQLQAADVSLMPHLSLVQASKDVEETLMSQEHLNVADPDDRAAVLAFAAHVLRSLRA